MKKFLDPETGLVLKMIAQCLPEPLSSPEIPRYEPLQTHNCSDG